MRENERPQRLTPTQQRAVVALLAERDIKSAAKAAGVGEATLHRWLHGNAAFQEALREAQTELFAESTRLLARLQSVAVASLASVLRDMSAPAAAKVSAARAILDIGDRRVSQADLEQRLTEIEGQLREAGAL